MAQVVVAGGGVIGAACAYYLAQRGLKPTVLEACTPACSASGKAGGFLALDWCDGSALGPLARTSFHLHAELAKALPDPCGYRRVRTHSLTVKAGAGGRRAGGDTGGGGLPSWIDPAAVSQHSLIGSEATTAQVHPDLFTKALLAEVERRGGAVRTGAAVAGLVLGGDGRVAGVRVRPAAGGPEEVLPADVVVLALGVWSGGLRELLPAAAPPPPPVAGLKVHSIVLADPGAVTTPDALFLSYRVPGGESLEPEVYPRPDASVYVCGVSSEEAPPAAADQVLPEAAAIATLRGVAAAVSQVRTCSTRVELGKVHCSCAWLGLAARPSRLPHCCAGAGAGRARGAQGAGLLLAVDRRRAAPHWPGARGVGRLPGDGPQLLGHPERAGHGAGGGGAHYRRQGHQREPGRLRPGAVCGGAEVRPAGGLQRHHCRSYHDVADSANAACHCKSAEGLTWPGCKTRLG